MNFEKLRKLNLKQTKEKIKESTDFNNFIVQSINNIDDVNRTSNTLVKRLREWYELYNPEFSRKIQDHEKFVETIVTGKDEKTNDSMGSVLKKSDLEPILKLAIQLDTLYKLKHDQEAYLEKIMKTNCPNIAAVAGTQIGARLISLAGDLRRLILFPASTVQLLGAEKALFRHMKTGARSPKHGIIHEHPLLTRASKKDIGKVARVLADKITIAARVDYFKGDFVGEELRNKLEKRFK